MRTVPRNTTTDTLYQGHSDYRALVIKRKHDISMPWPRRGAALVEWNLNWTADTRQPSEGYSISYLDPARHTGTLATVWTPPPPLPRKRLRKQRPGYAPTRHDAPA